MISVQNQLVTSPGRMAMSNIPLASAFISGEKGQNSGIFRSLNLFFVYLASTSLRKLRDLQLGKCLFPKNLLYLEPGGNLQ